MQRPGEEIIQEGIKDLIEGRESINALLVSIGAPRLRRVGVEVPDETIEELERRLYFKLRETHGDAAHSKYNALFRRLVRLERSINPVRGAHRARMFMQTVLRSSAAPTA